MDIYYNCKTCGQPYGFGRMTFKPAECNRCDPPPPYVPEPSDFELGEQEERERIIKLLDDIVVKWDTIRPGTDVSHYWLGLVTDALKYQIQGENK